MTHGKRSLQRRMRSIGSVRVRIIAAIVLLAVAPLGAQTNPDGTLLDANGDGVPDECCMPSAPIFLEPAKSRYLSLSGIGTPGVRSAIRVTFGPNAVFPAIEGQSFWVGPPREYPEEDSSNPGRTFVGAGLSCAPHFHDWSTIDTLQVYGAEIVPSSVSQQSLYTVQLINEGCPDSFESNFSPTMSAQTGLFADMVEPFFPEATAQPNHKDIFAVVIKFLGDSFPQNPNANIQAATQLQPNMVRPTNPVSFKDINATVGSFLGMSYVDIVSDVQSCTCPSLVTCGVTSCAVDSQCAGGVCLDGFCTDPCGRCTP